MHASTGLLAIAASLSTASAATFGFNYGAQYSDDSAKFEQNFAAEFNAAKKLVGTNGAFTSARLYTMIQHGTQSDVIQAIPAAIDTNTHLLLGLWASGDAANFKNELTALQKAIDTYPKLASLVDGISVGSEDMYRISEIGLKAPDAAPGNGPKVITDYISQVRKVLQGTALSGAKVGHVDTWTAWANSSNTAVAEASDFIGVDAYPYFEDTLENSIENAPGLFQDALDKTREYTGSVPIWITETGWAVSGPKKNLAPANTETAETYWQKVACKLLADDNMNTWWYTLHDSTPTTPSPSFGLLPDLNGEPAYDLSCKAQTSSSSKSASATKSSSKTATGSVATASVTGDLDSPGLSASNAVDASATAGSGYATGSAPIATGTAGAGNGGSSNGTSTFVASTVVPSAPTGAGSGAPGATDSGVATGAAVANGVSIAGVFGAVIAALLL